ncbi:phosphoinositide-interacting protein-like [Megalops cyprinoides]|uniref:phosphoinositide-interacting protein-like n=1 Tax=Megalops cyprinoides TaxID=118141 RepID=UPI001863B0D0|nr:phosphoinositide-interacting protein-like [Megalops cyprinoides]
MESGTDKGSPSTYQSAAPRVGRESLYATLRKIHQGLETPPQPQLTTNTCYRLKGLGMEANGNNIPLADRARSQSNDCLTESTVFSLSQSESLWTNESTRSAWEIYQYPILLLATGGAVFICGFVLSGLYFTGIKEIHRQAANLLGPALLSIGLMVLVVGLVLVPITKENMRPPMKRPFSYSRPPLFNL